MTQTADTIAAAFHAHTPRRVKNTHTDGEHVWHHNNLIACRDTNGRVHMTLAGWPTVTTRDRLNALGCGRFHQHRHVQYFEDRPIDAHDWVSDSVGVLADLALALDQPRPPMSRSEATATEGHV